MPKNDSYERVHQIALDNHGLVTPDAAKRVGVTSGALVLMARRGRLKRRWRGIYEDLGATKTRWTEYLEATLWPGPRAGALLSHESVLSALGLTDANPTKLHVTVSKKRRVAREVPAVLQIHRGETKEDERILVEGVWMTTVVRTIQDCARSGVGTYILEQAISEALRGGYIHAGQAKKIEAWLISEGQ